MVVPCSWRGHELAQLRLHKKALLVPTNTVVVVAKFIGTGHGLDDDMMVICGRMEVTGKVTVQLIWCKKLARSLDPAKDLGYTRI